MRSDAGYNGKRVKHSNESLVTINKQKHPPQHIRPQQVARDVAETLCAFANADGGVLLVGQESLREGNEDMPGAVTGVDYPPDKLELIRNAPYRLVVPPLEEVDIREEVVEGKRLLLFRVASNVRAHRLTDGRSLLRIDTRNLPYSEQTIAQLKQSQSPYERRPVHDARLEDLSEEALRWFARKIGWDDEVEAMLREYHLYDGVHLNRAAILLFAKEPLRWQDHADVTFVRYSGTQRGLGPQYQATPPQRLQKPLVLLIKQVYDTLQEYIPKRVEMYDLFFQEQFEYPTFAWQEAVVNAVAHRDYSLTGLGIEVWMFDDRLEVRSPGGPPSPITIEQLRTGQGAHYSRNPLIARVLTDCGYMREQGEGIPRMFAVMQDADLLPPELTLQDVRFAVTLRKTPIYDADTLRWLRGLHALGLSPTQKRVLALAKSRGMRFTNKDVQKHFHLDLYAASTLIKSLIRKGAVRLVEKGGRTYEVLNPALPEPVPEDLVALLPAFREQEKLRREALATIWKVPPHRAYRQARALVDAGWLELEGVRRGAAYRLTEKAKYATV